ncbi:MAG: SprT family zinc-dependent metalloprotease [Chloroflexales bacterium]|nr:SprT family zinc-dependent metalloprotease [Chloroflexales bacterium]
MPTTLIYHDVPIEMTRKAVKYLRLRITPAGAVSLSVPWHCPQSHVDTFVAQQWPWVEAQRAKLQTNITPPAISADAVVLFGVRYPIEVVLQTTRHVVIEADRIVLHITARDGTLAQQRQLMQFLHAQLTVQLTQLVPQWHRTMQTKVPTWQIRLSLVHLPLPCIEYVVIHELAHLFEANHGPKFWHLVTAFCPDWQSIRKQMRMTASS